MNRYEVTLTGGKKDRKIYTFTWAETKVKAIERIEEGMKAYPNVWAGWSFILTDEKEI